MKQNKKRLLEAPAIALMLCLSTAIAACGGEDAGGDPDAGPSVGQDDDREPKDDDREPKDDDRDPNEDDRDPNEDDRDPNEDDRDPNEDEPLPSVVSCAQSEGACEHECIDTPEGYDCVCPAELVLDEDGHRCVCPEGTDLCGGSECVPLDTAENCGACANACDTERGACVDDGEGFACICDAHYSDNGSVCEFSPCDSADIVCRGENDAGVVYDYLCIPAEEHAESAPLYSCRGLWHEWPVSAADLAPYGRFVQNVEEGTVFDNLTKLTWELNYAATTRNHANSVAHCESLELAGGGWRVPTIVELESIANFHIRGTSSYLPSSHAGTYWSASPHVGVAPDALPSRMWQIRLTGTGSITAAQMSTRNMVRCVR